MPVLFVFFLFNRPPPPELYTLSLHDALPISRCWTSSRTRKSRNCSWCRRRCSSWHGSRSEEHTSELQSRPHLVCRLLLEKQNSDSATPITRALGSAHCARMPP